MVIIKLKFDKYNINPEGNFCGQVVNQSVHRYVHSCLQLVTLIPMSTNMPSQKSVVLESSAKPGLSRQTDSPGLVWQKI